MAPANAFNCEQHALSSCIDSNQQWLSFSSERFTTIQESEALEVGKLTGTLAGIYQLRPIRINAPAQDIMGRDVPVVERVYDSQALVAAGLGQGLELGVALRLVSYQTGTGIAALRSRTSTRLATSAIRDPLVGLGAALPTLNFTRAKLSSKLRMDMSLPLGDAQNFAGERKPVAAPGLVGRLDFGWLSVAAQLGARFRQSVSLGSFRYNSQLFAALGLSAEVIRDTLRFGSEWVAAPSIGAQANQTRWIPAEWSVNVGLRWSPRYALTLSGGGALPLSSQHLDVGHERTRHERFAGLGSPAVRCGLMLRMWSAE